MTLPRTGLALAILVVGLASSAGAEQASPAGTTTSVPRVIRLDGQLAPLNGVAAAPVETVTLAIYASATDSTPLWQETQDVRVDAQGRYTVFAGATTPAGLPPSVLATTEARWLGVRALRAGDAEQPRVPLASVPYALRASDADTLGGLPPSAFLRADGKDGEAGAAGAAASTRDPGAPAVSTGSANFIGKFTNAVDLTSSVLFESNGHIGLGTTGPLDVLHSRFTDTSGGLTGLAVQNMGSGAASYSGMLFYDQNGALGQFQGFNNSTHEYRINNIASGGSINFMLGSSSKFLVANTGNIGIGTTSPSAPLEVSNAISAGTANVWVTSYTNAVGPYFLARRSRGTFAAPTAVQSGDQLSGLFGRGYGASAFGTALVGITIQAAQNWTDAAQGTSIAFSTTANNATTPATRMTLDQSGFLGIGTTTPGVPLDVVGSAVINTAGAGSFFSVGDSAVTLGSNVQWTTSIRASAGIIAGGGFLAASDRRVKHVRGRSQGLADLDTLLRIEVTDFTYTDVVEKGAGVQKKVIAQQVESVYPEAVRQTTDVVPDIYRKAAVDHDWITLATDLKVGERVRLITEDGERAVHTVKEVRKDGFRTDLTTTGTQVFVYGREVSDFRVVDYEAIAMLNVSATQELHRRLEQQEAAAATTAQELAALKAQLSELRAALVAARAGASGSGTAKAPQH